MEDETFKTILLGQRHELLQRYREEGERIRDFYEDLLNWRLIDPETAQRAFLKEIEPIGKAYQELLMTDCSPIILMTNII